MPFCVQCGNQIGDAVRFCPSCGKPQAPSASPRPDPWANLSDRTAATLCYIPWLGWAMSIVILASDRFRGQNRVRFHAFQGLYLFVVWLLVDWFLDPAFRFQGPFFGIAMITRMLKFLVFAAWVFMLIKVRNDEDFHLPILGELAEKSVSEQRL